MTTGCKNVTRALATTAVLLFSGCSFGVETAGEMPQAKGCGDQVSSGFYDGSLKHDGRERTFNVYIPEGYDGDSKRPLVVGMHGGLGTGEIFEKQARFAPAADRHGYLVAYPDGVSRAFNAGNCCGPPQEDNVDDVGFVAAMIDKVSERYCVDEDRVYGTGFSNGAMLTHYIACKRPELFTAIAPVAGSIMTDTCDAESSTPALLVLGRDDERVPWEGGTFRETYRMSMDDLVAKIGERNHCGAENRKVFDQGQATCMTREGCDEAPVTYCGIGGMGHQWPGGKTILKFMLGDNTEDYDATARIFEFFDSVGTE